MKRCRPEYHFSIFPIKYFTAKITTDIQFYFFTSSLSNSEKDMDELYAPPSGTYVIASIIELD
jgi:hypothetical protein